MRLIDADALHNSLRNKQKWVVRSFYGEKINEGYTSDQVHFAIDDAPTVEPIKVGDICKECWREGGNAVERKKGKWDFIGFQMFRCTACKHVFSQDSLEGWRTYTYEPTFPKFCPSCGAEMEQ